MPDILLHGQRGTYAFNPYDRANFLGEGGMGRVFVGLDLTTRRRVAVKVIHRELTKNPQVVQRAAREASLRFEHPNLVRMLDFVEAGGIYHLISDFVEGETLDKTPPSRVGTPEHRHFVVQRVAVPLLDALQVLHGQQPPVVHRDIKPANLMMRRVGSREPELVLLDLGVASIAGGQRMTQAGVKLGTPHYSAPEQIRGERDRISPATDLYAVGITLYELLTGKVPFDAPSDFDVMEMQVKTPLPAHPALPPPLFNVLRRATEKEPARRFPAAAAMKQALLAAGAGATQPVPPMPPWLRVGLIALGILLLRLVLRAWLG
jgi:serine/threonine-protein kinase